MRTSFDEQLALLNRRLIEMGALCEDAISASMRALAEEPKAAEKTKNIEREIDHAEREIEALCMKLLLQQQPVARDLRTISSALKMVTDMERVGHQAADIAEIITMANISASDDTLHISDMARSTIKMVTESIDAFVKKDINIAIAVIKYDDVVDNYFDQVKKTLIELFSKPETDGEYALDLLMIAKYFERIGDHAVNIAEWVLFSITGSKSI